jgi:hypothetical protein
MMSEYKSSFLFLSYSPNLIQEFAVVATKKTSSPGTTRSRTKKANTTPENQVSPQQTAVPSADNRVSNAGNGGGAAVALAREKAPEPSRTTPNFNYAPDVQERIRRRAYELYQQRGGQHGFDVQDWLKAESEFGRR